MGTRRAGEEASIDPWLEIIADEEEEENQENVVVVPHPPQVAIYRRRKKPQDQNPPVNPTSSHGQKSGADNIRVSLVVTHKRVSWNRSLSTRGRTSIAAAACFNNQPNQKQRRRKAKPPLPKAKAVRPPNFEKEKAYFQEVDAFELLEESPSPKKSGTWIVGEENNTLCVPQLTSRLEKWLISKKFNAPFEPSTTLSKILETPSMSSQSNLELSGDIVDRQLSFEKDKFDSHDVSRDAVVDLNAAIERLSLTSTCSTSDTDQFDSFSALLAVCGQPAPFKLIDVFSKYCDPESVVKVGEGTFGEAFMAGNYVCKIVPIDGDMKVNGEVQKRSEELLEEAVLSRTLNQLRGYGGYSSNACTTFIETIDLRVCQGSYDMALIRAWEDWDEKNGSENDHPKVFPEKQCYMIFVLEHGGKDLESFVLMNFDEARSLLVQVTTALAVAEAAFEFEHRDLHWGNILLSRNDLNVAEFILEGKHINFKTYGLSVSIIDFTLSRINTGKDILFLDLSTDPYLFKGPKGDRQAETYRKMKDVTDDCWEGSFPRTNVLWLLYLVDIILLKKSFERSSKNERELRSLKKSLDKCSSAREALLDPFFSDLMIVDDAEQQRDGAIL